MRIPRYWAKGSFHGVDRHGDPLRFEAWGWSNASEAEARQAGEERARNAFLAGSIGKRSKRTAEYDAYLNVPLREEIVDRLGNGDRDYAVITRNRYGALVLNASSVLFVDVDLPRSKYRRSILSYFSSKKRDEELLERHNQVVDRIINWSQQNPNYSFRLYQTKAGYRLLFTGQLFDPVGDEVERIFSDLGADGLYKLLTRKQECFRARLTPKPWRINMHQYQSYYSDLGSRDRYSQSDWINEYEHESQNYQVCTYVDAFGPTVQMTPEAAQVMAIHDKYTLSEPALPLA